jgi:hypothetical protein
MKKVSALLLTAMLGSSMVFAGISGSVVTKYGYDLDSKTLGFQNDNTDVEAVFTLSTEGETISEGDIHAEISASLDIDSLSFTEAGVANTEDVFVPADGVTVNDPATVWDDTVFTKKTIVKSIWDKDTFDDLDLSASIVGPNWTVNVSDAEDMPDYAQDYNEDGDGEEYFNDGFDESDVAGITVDYTYEEGKTVTVSLGQSNVFDSTKAQDNYVAITSPEFMLAEGLTAQTSVAGQYSKNSSNYTAAAMGATLAYMNEDAGYDVTANVDTFYYTGTEDFHFEGELVGNYSLATINAYFATNALVNDDADTSFDPDVRDHYVFAGMSGTNLLSAELTLDIAEVAEDVPVTVTLETRGMKKTGATDSKYTINGEVAYDVTLEDEAVLTLGVTGGYSFEDSSDWGIGGVVTYTPMDEMYTADFELSYFNGDNTIRPLIDIESTALVSGATLNLGYYASAFDLDAGDSNTLGNITATCEIEF